MAEGGGYSGLPDFDVDLEVPDDDAEQQKVPKETQPFQPDRASTPWFSGEEFHMQTMQHEKAGQPDTSFDEDEIPSFQGFIHADDKPVFLERARNFIKSRFPKVDFGKLGPIGFSKKGGNETTIVHFGPKGGETEIFKKDSGFLKKFTEKFKKSLGPDAESLIAQDNESIRETQQSLREAERQLQHAERINAQKEKTVQEVQDLRIRIE